MIAEDLGVITPPVYRLRDELGLPGMVVLHWAFGGKPSNLACAGEPSREPVVYTSTHDTDTTVGWYADLRRARARGDVPVDPDEPHWGLIEIAMRSRASLAIVPAQDVLGLGSEARMNRPGQVVRQLGVAARARSARPDALAARLRDATARGRRLVSKR